MALIALTNANSSPRVTGMVIDRLPANLMLTENFRIVEDDLIGNFARAIFLCLILLCFNEQILGALLGLGGLAGFAGAQARSANLLNISVVVSIIGLLISFQFIGEVITTVPRTAL